MLNYNKRVTWCIENSEGYPKTEGKYSRKDKLGRAATSLGWHLGFVVKGMIATHWMARLQRLELGKQEIATTLVQRSWDRQAREWGCYCGCKAWSMWYFFQEGHRKQSLGSWDTRLWPGVPCMSGNMWHDHQARVARALRACMLCPHS